MRRTHVLLAFMAIVFFVLNMGWVFAGDGKAQGQPFQYLQQQIDELREQIEAIQLTPARQGPPGEPGAPGAPGLPGTACWDLNHNGVCDPTEDIDGSGGCNALDCQSALGIGGLGVYDGMNIFLGYLVDYEPQWGTSPPNTGYGNFKVYNPDIPGYFQLSCASQNSTSPYIWGTASLVYIYFVSDNCTEQPYMDIGPNPLAIFRDGFTNEFYVVDTTLTPISVAQLNSRRVLANGGCQAFSGTGGLYFPAKKIDFPFADAVYQGNQLLKYPLTVRPLQ